MTNRIRCPDDESQDCVLWLIHGVIESELNSPARENCSESKLVAELRSEESQAKLPEDQIERSRDPVPSLKAALSCRSAPETQLIFKAIQWVGLAFRPLAVDELLHALNTSTNVSPHDQDLEAHPATVRSGEQLMELCFGLLEIDDAEIVGFTNAKLRTLVLSPDFPGASSMDGGSGHEMLAIVCIKHLQCIDRQTLLKPWVSTTPWLLNGRHECPLRGYATNFWNEHSRMAQSSCRYLTGTLHQAILGAISKDDKSDPFHMPTTRGRTNVGLWLCSFYGFKPLVKTYLEMGADPNSRTFWPETPLHAAVANSDFETVLLLLDRGGNPYLPNEMGFTSIDLAYSSRNRQMAYLLNHHTEDRECSMRLDATPAKHGLCGHFHSSQAVPQGGLPKPATLHLENANKNRAYSPKPPPAFIWYGKTQTDCNGTQQHRGHGTSGANEHVSSKRGHWQNGESKEVREASVADTQRLESLVSLQANFTQPCCNRLQSPERCESTQHEEWIVVERDDVKMEMT